MSISFLVVAVLVLTGCSLGSSTERQLADAMAEMNKAEKEYRAVQAELTELEKSEQKLFKETMELTQGQQAELTTKVAELEKLLGQRLDYLEQEELSMSKAQQSAGEFEGIIDKAADEEKSKIEELTTAVNNRYALHSAFVSDYKELCVLQQELYAMLGAEDTNVTGLQRKVGEVNIQNDNVESAITLFNEATEKVNVLKDDVFASLQKD